MRVATVVGNRPQFVKAAVVSRRLRERATEILIHTGQHYDDELSQIFFDELDLAAPDHRLELGTGSNTQQTSRMLAALEPLFVALAPDVVLVYGDTNSTLAGALCAAQQGIAIAHVEAGMRSFDHRMPEELNRVLTDHCSDLLLCSTQTAIENLERERARGERHLVGDVMADLALATVPIAEQRSDVLERLGLEAGSYLLVTAHRAGTVDDPDRLAALVGLLEALPAPVIFALHPRTRAKLEAAGRLESLASSGLTLTAPLGYLDMIRLTGSARAVLTDSGGLQKEALVLGTPCVTLRDTTEWTETVDSGWNVLVDLDRDAALAALERPRPADAPADLYGGGHAGERIGDVLAAYTCER